MGIDILRMDGGRFRGTLAACGHCRCRDRGESSFCNTGKGPGFLGRPSLLAGATIGVEEKLASAG